APPPWPRAPEDRRARWADSRPPARPVRARVAAGRRGPALRPQSTHGHAERQALPRRLRTVSWMRRTSLWSYHIQRTYVPLLSKAERYHRDDAVSMSVLGGVRHILRHTPA